MIVIDVKAYGLARRRLAGERTVTAAAPLTVAELLERLGLAAEGEEELMVLYDNQVVDRDFVIGQSCAVALVPPLCGG